MNKAARLIGRSVITVMLALFFTAVVVGGLDLISTVWRILWPEYRAYVLGAVACITTRPAWSLVKQEGAAEQ